MDCHKAQTAIMQQIEKTIKPADARDLTKHILKCEDCRDLYLAMDEAAELPEAELTAAPDDFMQQVMAQVHQLPAYTTPVAARGQMGLRVLWGLSAVIFGVGLFFFLNPDLVYTLVNTYPAAAAIRDGLQAIGAFGANALEWIAQSAGTATFADMPSMSIGALVLVGVMGTLIYVLHRMEKGVQT